MSADELLKVQERLRAELDSLETDEHRLPQLREETARLRGELCAAALALSKKRHKARAGLERGLQTEFESLGLSGARFVAGITRSESADGILEEKDVRYALSPTGVDVVEFLFSANAGEEPKPLRKVASGGELSRIMLGLKSVLSDADPVPTMVFDEIDTGIGGKVADAVGKRLARLSRNRQVICITHLPQIARYADDHLLAVKSTSSGRAVSGIRRLDAEDRVRELARMSAGDRVTPAALAHARDLLGSGRRGA